MFVHWVYTCWSVGDEWINATRMSRVIVFCNSSIKPSLVYSSGASNVPPENCSLTGDMLISCRWVNKWTAHWRMITCWGGVVMGTSRIFMCSTKQLFVCSSATEISQTASTVCEIRTHFFYLCSPLMQVYATMVQWINSLWFRVLQLSGILCSADSVW